MQNSYCLVIFLYYLCISYSNKSMKDSRNKQGKLKKSYIINHIVEQFNPYKFDFFDIIYKNGNPTELFEFTLPEVFITFNAKADCYDTGMEYVIEDITLSELEVWDNESRLVSGLITPKQIETVLKNINFNL